MKILKLFTVLYFVANTSHFVWSSDSFSEEDPSYQTGLQGLVDYENGEYLEAAKHLKEALDKGHHFFSLSYADICRRNLDNANHPLEEAAECYIIAAESGDGDALSYLHSLSLNLEDTDKPVKKLVKIWVKEDPALGTNRGLRLYSDGNYTQAARSLKVAANENDTVAQQLYADICYRQLDHKPHTLKEAAMFYLLSAYGMNPETFSYLKGIIPNIFDNPEPDYNLQMCSIVRNWVIEQTIADLKPLKPGQINDFLISTFSRKINKTTAQKLPYIFDKTMAALVCYCLDQASIVDSEPLVGKKGQGIATQRTEQNHTFIDEDVCLIPDEQTMEVIQTDLIINTERSSLSVGKMGLGIYGVDEQDNIYLDQGDSSDDQSFSMDQTDTNTYSQPTSQGFGGFQCSQEHRSILRESFVAHQTSCFSYGPVYYNYFVSLDKNSKLDSESFLNKPKKVPSIPVIYHFVLTSINEVTKDMSASDLTNLTHQDYPWILAGIKFWQEANPRKSLNISGFSDTDLINKLVGMEELISEDVLNQVLMRIDGEKNRHIWQNDKDHHISKEYQENLRRYFVTPISRECNIIQSIQGYFFESLKSHKLDLQEPFHLEILQTPFLMYSCEQLELDNLGSTKKLFEILSEGQRYFTYLKQFTVNYSSKFKEDSQYGRKIRKIVAKIEKRFSI